MPDMGKIVGRPLLGKPAIFLDKDGTLLHDVPFNVDPKRIAFTPHAIHALQQLQQHGYKLFIVTNQAGMAKGLFGIEELRGLQEYLVEFLAKAGVRLDGFYYCPHHPQGKVQHLSVQCTCRKPLPGMLMRAAHENEIDLENSWMIGDILHDVEAGNRAGCKTVLIYNGNETEWQMSAWRIPYFVAGDLLDAANLILQGGSAKKSATRLISTTEETFRQ